MANKLGTNYERRFTIGDIYFLLLTFHYSISIVIRKSYIENYLILTIYYGASQIQYID